MKIIHKTEFVFEEGDKELIFSKIPNNPCKDCLRETCFCCSKGESYKKTIETLRKHGVLELSREANEYYEIGQKIHELNAKRKNLRKKFAALGLDINQIFNSAEK